MGQHGAIALDYNVLFACGVEYGTDLFSDIQIMESAALERLHSK